MKGSNIRGTASYTGAAPNQNSYNSHALLFRHYGNRFLLRWLGTRLYPSESNQGHDTGAAKSRQVVNEMYVARKLRVRPTFSRTMPGDREDLRGRDLLDRGWAGTLILPGLPCRRFRYPAGQPIASLTTTTEWPNGGRNSGRSRHSPRRSSETLGTVRAPLRDRLQTATGQTHRYPRQPTPTSKSSRRRGHRARRQCRPRTRAAELCRVRGAAARRSIREQPPPAWSRASDTRRHLIRLGPMGPVRPIPLVRPTIGPSDRTAGRPRPAPTRRRASRISVTCAGLRVLVIHQPDPEECRSTISPPHWLSGGGVLADPPTRPTAPM